MLAAVSKIFSLGVLALLISCSEPSPEQPPSQEFTVAETDSAVEPGPPNFLIIHVDDLDFDELGVYWNHPDPKFGGLPSYTRAERLDLAQTGRRGQTLGYSGVGPMSTPNIDSIAQEGMLFSHYYVTSPVCTPSRFSLLTGKYASRSRALQAVTPEGEVPLIAFNTPLEGEQTFPQLLQQQGYMTGLAGKWHNFGSKGSYRGNGRLGDFRDADPGNAEVAAALEQRYQMRVSELLAQAGFDFVGALYPGNVEELGIPRSLYGDARHNVEWVTAAARRFLERHATEPFMLYVAHTVPHGWMGDIGQDDQRVLTPKGILGEAPKAGMPSRSDVYSRVRRAGNGRPMATWLDDSVGELLRILERLGIDDNTVVIFTSDHGNRGKESVYEAARVPLLVRWPGHVQPGSVSHALLSNIDIAPTLLSLAGARVSTNFDGLDMAPIWTRQTSSIRDALMLEMSVSRAVVTRDWKYIANRPPPEIARRMAQESSLPREERRYGWDGNWQRNQAGEWRESNRISYRNQMFFPAYFDLDQLYDLHSDNMELVNLAAEPAHAAQLASMQQELAELLRFTRQPVDQFFPAFHLRGVSAVPRRLSDTVDGNAPAFESSNAVTKLAGPQ